MSLRHYSTIFLIGLAIFPNIAFALRVDIQADPNEVEMGGEVLVTVRVDPEGENINAIEGRLIFEPAELVPIAVRDERSVVSLWVERPSPPRAESEFSFSGLIPGGFNGVIDSFSATLSPGAVFGVLFKTKREGVFTVSVEGVNVLLNDGQGTGISLSDASAEISVGELDPETASIPTARGADRTPPQILDVRLVRDDLLYDGARTLIFRGRDTESGISHFEIREGSGSWVLAKSPYRLQDQKSSGVLYIKAVDNAGNQTTQTVSDDSPESTLPGLLLTAAVIILILGGFWFARLRRLRVITSSVQ
jgi:hypothetical protein